MGRDSSQELQATKVDSQKHTDFVFLSHEEIKILNRLRTSKETESVIKDLPTEKILEPDSLIVQFYQTFTELTLVFFRLF